MGEYVQLTCSMAYHSNGTAVQCIALLIPRWLPGQCRQYKVTAAEGRGRQASASSRQTSSHPLWWRLLLGPWFFSANPATAWQTHHKGCQLDRFQDRPCAPW
jgi:hypothetical protein